MGRPGDYVKASGPATWVITAVPFSGLDPEIHERGVPIVIARQRSIPPQSLDPAIKSISRLASVLARRDAFDRGAHEAVLLDAAGNLTEGTASNVFLVKNGVLMTPALPDGGLPGVTREAVMELAREAENPVVEDRIPGRDLDRADEILLTNTCWEILPVVDVEGRQVGTGASGRWARELLRRYRDLVRKECGVG
jgi:branched-chain amino acid aminotransferase